MIFIALHFKCTEIMLTKVALTTNEVGKTLNLQAGYLQSTFIELSPTMRYDTLYPPPQHTHTKESLMQLGPQEPGKSKSHLNRPHYDVVPLRAGSSPNPGTGVPEVTGFLIKLC